MKTTVSLLVLATVAFVVTGDPVSGHGGRYRGPGDMLTAPDSPGPDLTVWTFWWEYNRDRYWPDRTLRPPARAVVDARVVPALQRVLREEESPDIVSAALLALARCGNPGPDDKAEPRRAEVIGAFLSHDTQRIAEAAVLALGLLGDEASTSTLLPLLLDSEDGRKLVGRDEVPIRTRAFAAFALGGIGERATSEQVRREIVGQLARLLIVDESPVHDLKVACVISLGMVPLPIDPAPATSPDPEGPPLDTRGGQIDFLRAYLADVDHRGLVRAHVPRAVVRLVHADPPAGIPVAQRAAIAQQMLAYVRHPGDRDALVVQSAVLALGGLGGVGVVSLDAEIRAALMSVPRVIRDRQAYYYSLIALAQACTGASSDSGGGVEQTAKHLLDHMQKGKGQTQTWAGLAVAILGRRLQETGEAPDTVAKLVLALRTALGEEKSAQKIAAHALAGAILEDRDAADVVLAKLEAMGDPEAKGTLAVSLGLLGAREGIEPIRKLIRSSKYKPELLQQAALALGLYGDPAIAPELVDLLVQAKGLATQAALASAIGACGDERTIDPLLAVLGNEEPRDPRAWAAVALGLLCNERGDPWFARIAVDMNYRAATRTLVDLEGTGLLNIL